MEKMQTLRVRPSTRDHRLMDRVCSLAVLAVVRAESRTSGLRCFLRWNMASSLTRMTQRYVVSSLLFCGLH